MATPQRDQLMTSLRALPFDGPGQPTSAQLVLYLDYIRTQSEEVCQGINNDPIGLLPARVMGGPPAAQTVPAVKRKKLKPPPMRLGDTWTDSREGVIVGQELISLRTELCNEIINRVNQKVEPRIYICSPPFSGKTSLLCLIKYQLEQLGYDIFILSWGNAGGSEEEVDAFWRENQPKWKEAIEKECYILVDEGQRALRYPAEHSYWASMKTMTHPGKPSSARVIIFATYGLSVVDGVDVTPIDFQHRLYYDDVRLTEKEAFEILESYRGTEDGKNIPLPDDMFRLIITALNYHPGLLRVTLIAIRNRFVDSTSKSVHPKKVTIDEIFTYLNSNDLSTLLFQSRGLSYVQSDTFPQEHKNILHEILINESCDVENNNHRLLSRGICRSAPSKTHMDGRTGLEFISKYVRECYRRNLYMSMGFDGELRFFKPTSPTAQDFLFECIHRMEPKRLIDNCTSANSTPTEYIWQDEFYRTACSILRGKQKISPEFGRLWGIKGRIDFIVNSDLNYGFELLRDGKNLTGHTDRTVEGHASGYFKLVDEAKLQSITIVDFRNIRISQPKEEVYYVLFADDFTSYTIKKLIGNISTTKKNKWKWQQWEVKSDEGNFNMIQSEEIDDTM